MHIEKFLIQDGEFLQWGDEFAAIERWNKQVAEGRPLSPDTGYIGGTRDGAIGCAEAIGQRGKIGPNDEQLGGQQDAIAMGFLDADTFPRDDKDVEQHFLDRAADIGSSTSQLPGGSTLISAVVDTRTNKIWTANMGDSNFLLVTEQKDGKLTVEELNSLDKPSNSDEKSRIFTAGGRIYSDNFYNEIGFWNEIFKLIQSKEPQPQDLPQDFENFKKFLRESTPKRRSDGEYSPRELKISDHVTFFQNVLAKYGRDNRLEKCLQDLRARSTSILEDADRLTKEKGKELRLDGVLSVSAGFGDSEIHAVRRTPKMQSCPVPSGRSWLIGGCDGMLENVPAEQTAKWITDIVTKPIAEVKGKEPSSIEMAKVAKEAAAKSGSQDNISIVVVALHRLPKGTVSEYAIADGHGDLAHELSHAVCGQVSKSFVPSPTQSAEQKSTAPSETTRLISPAAPSPTTQPDYSLLKLALQNYRSVRNPKDEYLNCYGRLFGHSRTDKISAVDKLLKAINTGVKCTDISDTEKTALFSSKLGKITHQYRSEIETNFIGKNTVKDQAPRATR